MPPQPPPRTAAGTKRRRATCFIISSITVFVGYLEHMGKVIFAWPASASVEEWPVLKAAAWVAVL